jgi:hypothetical protein
MSWPNREKHETKVVKYADGNCNFECTCGAHSRSGPSRPEAEAKARMHRDAAKKR